MHQNFLVKYVTELTKNTFDQYEFHNLVVKLTDDYPSESAPKLINDKVKASDLGLMLGRSVLSDMVRQNWDYEKNVNIIIAEVKKEFPDAGKIKCCSAPI